MHEGDIRELFGNPDGGVHKTERRGEDNVVAGLGQHADGALGVGTFGHVFHIGGLNLVTEVRLNGFAAQIVLVTPAVIPDGANVDKSDFHRVFCHYGRR